VAAVSYESRMHRRVCMETLEETVNRCSQHVNATRPSSQNERVWHV
jgi:hypothetical protein